MCGFSLSILSGRWSGWAVCLSLLTLHVTLAFNSMSQHCATVDEGAHLLSGFMAWTYGDFEYYYVNPPLIKMVTSLPMVVFGANLPEGLRWSPAVDLYAYNDRFVIRNKMSYSDMLMHSRCMNVFISCMGGLFLYRWARQLYGQAAGIVATALWALSPTVIGWAGVCTVDLGASVMGLAVMHGVWTYLNSPSWRKAVFAGSVLGLGLLSKFTLLILCPIIPLIWLSARWAQRGSATDGGGEVRWRHLVLVLGFALLAVNTGYGFQRTLQPLGTFAFRSHLLSRLTSSCRLLDPWLKLLPVPLPAAYVSGLDHQKGRADSVVAPMVYLRGRWRSGVWEYYYLYALAVKTTLGTVTLALFALGFALLTPRVRLRAWEELIMMLPLCAILGIITANMRNQFSSIRYIMPTFPFLFLGISRVGIILADVATATSLRGFALLYPWKVVGAGIVIGSLVWNGVSLLRVHPHELSYFNEIANGPDRGWEHLIESNIDWGQDLLILKRWAEAHPSARPLRLAYYGGVDPHVWGVNYQLAPTADEAASGELLPGWYAISVNFIAGASFRAFDEQDRPIRINRDDYRYFRDVKPYAKAGYSIFVFHITREQSDLLRVRLATSKNGE
jgi:hypothetical protein